VNTVSHDDSPSHRSGVPLGVVASGMILDVAITILAISHSHSKTIDLLRCRDNLRRCGTFGDSVRVVVREVLLPLLKVSLDACRILPLLTFVHRTALSFTIKAG